MKPNPKGWPRISTAVFYNDAAAAIDWLCRAFGFEIKIKVDGEDGSVVHSELVFGDGLVMVGGVGKDAKRVSPQRIGGANTQSIMFYVDDAKVACERARAAGAKILREPSVSDYGEDYWSDLGFEAEDPEGHRWWIVERLRDPK
jgi:uncharacterized glyoxalase superfamily protein PhnB